MSKRLIALLALAFVFCIAGAAYAEVQNIKVSGDLFLHGITRDSLTLKDNDPSPNGYGETINSFLSQVRLRVDADLTDNVAATVRLLNERTWGDEADYATVTAKANNSEVDIDLAYVTLKEFLNSPVTVVVGRQGLRYGNGLVVGDPDTNGIADGHGTTARYLPNSLDDLSVRKSFDAIKAILNYDPLIVDLVYSKIDENNVGATDDISLYGVNAAFQVDDTLTTETYLWNRARKATGSGATVGNTQTENLRTVGSRAVFTGFENIILGLEGAFQFGDHIANTALYPNERSANVPRNRKVTAYAIQAVAQLALPDLDLSPVISGSYTYLSGDPYLSESDNYRGWDPMYEDQAGGTLYNKILGYSNAQLFNLNGTVVPMEDVKVTLKYWYLRLNRPFTVDATSVVLSGVTGDPSYRMNADKKELGHEVDLIVSYDYTEDVQFVLNTGVFLPGDAFHSDNEKKATQVIGSMKVSF
ncbi:MAG: alginate export family protein [Candidatus Omnitrophica bacterium]|nr:alginate export family protein [Candidatus Omnitrophota bacterium]